MSLSQPSRLHNDFYQLTMAQALWRSGRHDLRAVFHLSFRRVPFGGGFIVSAGQQEAVRRATSVLLEEADVSYLSDLRDARERRLFEPAFLDFLATVEPACSVVGAPEGTIVFAGEPVLRVEASLLEAQLLETPLLNAMAFPSLIATKAARVRLAAGDDPVLEFGLRRAPGGDFGLEASRCAFIGGADATSNLEAGRVFGIPVQGTHAHSWILAFDSEGEAMSKWLGQASGERVLLLDTFDTLAGLERALEVVAAEGHELDAVRLDSGDLDALSRSVRARLDGSGWSTTRIVASGNLDEESILELRSNGAPIDTWGVGTRLVTGGSEGALSAVYKLGAIHDQGSWVRRSKTSDDPSKATLPGRLSPIRIEHAGCFRADLIVDELDLVSGEEVTPDSIGRWLGLVAPSAKNLFVDLVEEGRAVGPEERPTDVRSRVLAQLENLPPGLRRLDPEFPYRVALHPKLASRVPGWEVGRLRYDRAGCSSSSLPIGSSG